MQHYFYYLMLELNWVQYWMLHHLQFPKVLVVRRNWCGQRNSVGFPNPNRSRW